MPKNIKREKKTKKQKLRANKRKRRERDRIGILKGSTFSIIT